MVSSSTLCVAVALLFVSANGRGGGGGGGGRGGGGGGGGKSAGSSSEESVGCCSGTTSKCDGASEKSCGRSSTCEWQAGQTDCAIAEPEPGCCLANDDSNKNAYKCYDLADENACSMKSRWTCAWKSGDASACAPSTEAPSNGCCEGTTIDNMKFFDCWDISGEADCTKAATPALGNCIWREDGVCPYPTASPTESPLANALCLDFDECTDMDMSAAAQNYADVRCGGGDSCQNVIPMEAKHDIECSGQDSCYDSVLISQDKGVFCSGGSACSLALHPGDHFATMGAPKWQGGAQIDAVQVDCSGYESCLEVQSISATTVSCDGALGCYQVNEIDAVTSVWCGGRGGCAFVDHIATQSPSCMASSSCMGSNIVTSSLSCQGSYSCAYSKSQLTYAGLYGAESAVMAEFLTAEEVYAYGYQSFREGVLDSKALDMKVWAYGAEAGLDAYVICRAGSSCILDCANTACKGLTYVCEPGATCELTAMPQQTSPCLTDGSTDGQLVEGYDCPTMATVLSGNSCWNDDECDVGQTCSSCDGQDCTCEFPEMAKLALRREALKADDMAKVALHSSTKHKKSMLSADASSTQCFDEKECLGHTFNEHSNIVCEGEKSCVKGTFGSVVEADCFGQESCAAATFGFTPVECQGALSCADATYEALQTGGINCAGWQSCVGMTASDSPSLMNPGHRAFQCNGEMACNKIDMYVSDASVVGNGGLECGGSGSCSSSGIYVTGDIGTVSCSGAYACDFSFIRADASKVECSGYNGCAKGDVDSAQSVDASGYLGLRGTTVTSPWVIATGYRSAEDATISSGGRDSLRVEMLGDDASAGADVTCNDEVDGCTLVCAGTGCASMKLWCLGTGECDIEPKGCLENPSNDGTVIFEGVTCPKVYYDLSQESMENAERVEADGRKSRSIGGDSNSEEFERMESERMEAYGRRSRSIGGDDVENEQRRMALLAARRSEWQSNVAADTEVGVTVWASAGLFAVGAVLFAYNKRGQGAKAGYQSL